MFRTTSVMWIGLVFTAVGCGGASEAVRNQVASPPPSLMDPAVLAWFRVPN